MPPDYRTNDPRGWCGDSKRGAALGRTSVRDLPTDYAGEVFLRRVYLDEGGYDELGTYWGAGKALYWVATEDGRLDHVFRVREGDRDVARKSILDDYPRASVVDDEAETRKEIVWGIARAIFVDSFGSFVEEVRTRGTEAEDLKDLTVAGPGEDAWIFSPPTSGAAKAFAERTAGAIERLSGASLPELYLRAGIACRTGICLRVHKLEDFGGDLGVMLLGSGCSWFDDHEPFRIAIPEAKFHIFSREDVSRGEDEVDSMSYIDERFVERF